MLSKRTIIGLIFGIAIITLGAASLILHTGLHTDDFQDIIEVGSPVTYTIPAPEHSPQSMTIIGSTFNLELHSPGDGLQIPETSYKDKFTKDWVHSVNGDTKIQIKNTGDDELEITAITIQTPTPLGITFDFMVVISGLVIIGFSMGFTIRKPKGF